MRKNLVSDHERYKQWWIANKANSSKWYRLATKPDFIYREYICSMSLDTYMKVVEEWVAAKEYSDGTKMTFYPNKPWLNKYGYSHADVPCKECGEFECDINGLGHYRG